ncbi:MAG: BMP family ABC transporter substrate-binding protein [Lachnospiraceae bacterium]|nr:BMP family ABC transporter substrate-binding protein [Lachnospiraceae bacterium]
MKKEQIRVYGMTLLGALSLILILSAAGLLVHSRKTDETIRVGFVYVGDSSTGYTNNFYEAQKAVEKAYGDSVVTIAKYNVPEDKAEVALQELIAEECKLIFSTSYGYGETTKIFAKAYPEIQFCQATCANANEEPYLDNYHTFMGRIYEGRYVSGVAAGMKLRELIDEGKITGEQAKVGYVAAFPYAEVISGYTSFLLGVRSVAPEAVMTVKYTNTWGDYHLEKECAKKLIDEGCVIISQHSDTIGPASACEETDRSQNVFFVSYNESMSDIAPTTYLTGCKINWEPYILEAVEAVLYDKEIEKQVEGTIYGNDVGAGFEKSWVEMLEINEFVAAEGTKEKVESLIRDFKNNKVRVFLGDYTGVDPQNPEDTIDLRQEYIENKESSAPTFHYILDDVIHVEK